jgi:uncharacterized protein (TIGR02147 family)
MQQMPDVMNYSDYRHYLRDVMTYEKEASKATLASMGKLFGMSAPALQMVHRGERNLSVHKVYKITRVLKFSSEQTEYFEALVLKEQAENADEACYYDGKLLRMRGKSDLKRLRVSDPVLFSRWYIPALMLYLVEIAPGGEVSMEVLSQEFSVPKEELEIAVRELRNSGLLSVTAQGQFRIQADKISSTVSQKKFLKSFLDEVSRRVDSEFKSPDSFFTSDTMTLSLSHFRSFVSEHRSLVEKYMGMSVPACERAVFQTGFFAFPVTYPK